MQRLFKGTALENVQKEIAIKYRSVKKQEDGKMRTNKQIGDKVKTD